jgi:hypothetical protein
MGGARLSMPWGAYSNLAKQFHENFKKQFTIE